MNIGSKLLAAGLLVGMVGCSTEETVYVDNMDEDAKDALSNSRRAGMNTNLTSMPGPGAS